jgi:hypothetical protein
MNLRCILVTSGPPAWGLGVGLTTPRRKKNKLVMKIHFESKETEKHE